MMYQGFAGVYDALMKHTDYGKWTDYIEQVFRHYERTPKTIVDLACGTGSITALLARRGYSVIGVDASEDMLDAAREKHRKLGLKVPFICQDMRDLSLHRPVDAIICMCDGFNYLLSHQDLERTFSRIYHFLKPGGLLLFDLSTKYKLSSILGNKTMVENTEDISLIWDNHYDPIQGLLTMDLTFFVKEGTLYRRMEETHIQKAHSPEVILDMLTQQGFGANTCFSPFSLKNPKKRDQRVFLAGIRNFY